MLVGPVVAVITLRELPGASSDVLKEYQSLFAGYVAIFAASIAFAGVRLTLRNQRVLADRADDRRKRQFAAAFIGEINSIVRMLKRYKEAGSLDVAIMMVGSGAIRRGEKSLGSEALRLAGDFMTFYKSNSSEAGHFGPALAERIISFYGGIDRLRDRLDRVHQELQVLDGHISLMPTAREKMIEALIASAIRGLDRSVELGVALATDLRGVVDEPE